MVWKMPIESYEHSVFTSKNLDKHGDFSAKHGGVTQDSYDLWYFMMSSPRNTVL